MSQAADAAYQGAPGAFSEDAALALLGGDARLHPCPALDDVIRALITGVADAAVVPIENTLAGAVPGAADLIARHPVQIVAERIQPIVHAIIGPPGALIGDVRRVWSHPVALAQCERWFRAHPHVTAMPAFDTAGAVADVLRRGTGADAAIAGRRAVELYRGSVLADGVQDEPANFTRFVLVRRRVRGPKKTSGTKKTSGVFFVEKDTRRLFSGRLKTSLVCVLPNQPGALVQALRPFEVVGLNLSRIESRPIPEAPFEYRFHLDVGPTSDAKAVRKAIGALRRRCRSVRVLGTYPAPDC